MSHIHTGMALVPKPEFALPLATKPGIRVGAVVFNVVVVEFLFPLLFGPVPLFPGCFLGFDGG